MATPTVVVNPEPLPQLNWPVLVEVFLNQRQGEFVDGLQAAAAIIPVAREHLTDLGYPEGQRVNWLYLEIETIACFNRRQHAVDEDRRARSEWIESFQQGARP